MNASTARCGHFYIGGEWVAPLAKDSIAVENPATEQSYATVAHGGRADVDRAVAAARKAFEAFSQTSKQERLALLGRLLAGLESRAEDLAQAMTLEMGSPIATSRDSQVACSITAMQLTIEYLGRFEFALQRGSTRIFKEPIGVCALITPWNWPLLEIVCKVSPALAAGCTVVLKPSEYAPLSAILFAEIAHAAGVPPGVFNLVHGKGTEVGQALAGHPDVDAVSFTGSTRGGIAVGVEASRTVKRVLQELGGKSPNIILPDADLDASVRLGVQACFGNSGQGCTSPARLLVPESQLQRATEVARVAADAHVVGDPLAATTMLGPLANKPHFEKVQRLIQRGIDEGAKLVTGGPGRPAGLARGYYARPTVFTQVRPDMTIAREEIFGPVIGIIPYRSEEEAIHIANDTEYGLGARVASGDLAHARKVATKLRFGGVVLNYAPHDWTSPFGGFKQSGNGRAYADFGIEEYVDMKSVIGYGAV
mgnify:CR=1 FL=1